MFLCVGSVWREGLAAASELMSEEVQRGPEGESASRFPLFNASFIHLQNTGIPTLFQPHIENRHTLHSFGTSQ